MLLCVVYVQHGRAVGCFVDNVSKLQNICPLCLMPCYETCASIALHVDSTQEFTAAVADTVPSSDFTTNLWSRAGHLKLTLASSASSVKAGTVNTVSALRDTAKYGGSVLAAGAWNTGLRLKDTAALLKDSAVSTGSVFKDSFSETAVTVKNSAMTTGETLKTNISDRAREMKDGISATFCSLRSKTESYFTISNDDE